MIVPFLMTMLTNQDRPYLWAFYKFLDLAKKEHGAIIAQEEYFIDPGELAKEGRSEASNKFWNIRSDLNYDLPTQKDLQLIQKYSIPKDFENRLIEKMGSINDAHMLVLSQVIDELKEMIGQYLDDITHRSKEKIDAIMTLCHNPSLSAAAEERGIPVIHFEIGTFREPAYLKTGYFDFHCLYGNASTEERYHRFLSEIENTSVPIFNNREILAILLRRDCLHYLNHLNDKPKYEMGIALGYAVWPLYQRNTLCDDAELLYRASKIYSLEQLLVRRHPGDPFGATYPKFDYCRDGSATTLDFILQCKRIASVGSNLSFEAMLFGKTSYVMTECPYTYKTKRKIEDTSLQEYDLTYLNFYTFCYLVPFRLLWDKEYVLWRLSNPPETEIYQRHLAFYLKEKQIPETVLEAPFSERFSLIMKAQNYDLNAKYAKAPLKERRIFTVSDYQKEIRRLNNLLGGK